jgi:hypothetical protein
MADISAPDPESVHIQTTEHQLTQEEIVPVVYRQFSIRWQNWILPAAGLSLVIAGAVGGDTIPRQASRNDHRLRALGAIDRKCPQMR